MENQLQVLLLEDDPMVQEVNKQFINSVDGFHVMDMVSNGVEGKEKIKEQMPDLVILDVYMPGEDGLEVLRYIRQEGLSVDIIAVTAATDKQTIRTILQHGAVDYIIKPFKFERMKHALEQYKKHRRQLEGSDPLAQHHVDQLLYQSSSHNEGLDTRHDLPKGLNQQTLTQVQKLMEQEQEPKSAEEVAVEVGIARVTARRYLEYLKEVGKIDLSVQYGSVGRPMNRYVRK
ncbi:response regulator [Pontibacillus sp. ALD_SL1]|uniref:response regulator n=1 Tax=Pontibacillus sp. ALD_SL1 TaxID=2777185 RepID=UPI001A97D0AD|nr:response regulator [Pontibacillus sp. ALD_SL1]QST00998.1 response regulator [Pontibacillus sp. ALD_SL1]